MCCLAKLSFNEVGFGYLVSGDAGIDSRAGFCFGIISKAALTGKISMFCLVCLGD